jgi:multiple sugar transport system ATP-binding protein
MRYEFAGLHKALGTTMIYVTHDQVEAMTLADRIVVLNGGVIEQVGTPDDLYARPDTIFVAGFIGSPTMNLIPATYAGPGAKGATVRLAGGQVIETVIATETMASGAALTLGVRPEHVGTDGATNRLTGVVGMVESLGAVHHVHLAIDGLAEPLVASLPTRPTADALAVAMVPEALHLFDERGHALQRPALTAPRAAA